MASNPDSNTRNSLQRTSEATIETLDGEAFTGNEASRASLQVPQLQDGASAPSAVPSPTKMDSQFQLMVTPNELAIAPVEAGLPADKDKVASSSWAILTAMFLAALITQMFSTAIGPCLPSMAQELSLSLSAQTWIMSSYSLTFGAFLVAGGRLGDLVGEVRIILIGFFIFALGLVMAALANGDILLIVGRAVQGVGTGISAPATLSIVVNVFPPRQQGVAISLWGVAHGIGILIGPFVASYIMQALSWRWVFWISIPLCLGIMVITALAARGYKSVLAKGSYDVFGLILGAGGFTAITVGLQSASTSWSIPATWASLVAGALGLAAFVLVELKVKYPLVDLSLFKIRMFSGAFFAECATGFVYIPMLVFIGATYLIEVLNYTPVQASWIIIITTGTCMIVQFIIGLFVEKVGPGIFIVIGLSLQSAALFGMGCFTPTTTLAQLSAPLAIMGAGVGITLISCNIAGMSVVDQGRAGMASGLIQMTFNVPAALGIAVVTSIIGTASASKIASAMPGTDFDGLAVTYVEAINSGNWALADQILASVPPDVQADLLAAQKEALAATISIGMFVLASVALLGAIMAAIVIGTRKVGTYGSGRKEAPIAEAAKDTEKEQA